MIFNILTKRINMNYYLHPSVNITMISETKIQISSVNDTFTLEDQNNNVELLIDLLKKGVNFPSPLLENEALREIFELLKDNSFLTQEKLELIDAMPLDLSLISETIKDSLPTQHAKLNTKSINLMGNGELFERVKAELTQLKIKVLCNPLPNDLLPSIIVCCSDKPNFSFFENINSLSIDNNLPALFANLDGSRALIGPFVVPKETSCFTCYTHRIAPNIQFIEEALANQRWQGNIVFNKAAPKMYAMEASFHIISQLFKYYNGSSHLCLINEVLDIDLINYDLTTRPVMRIPNCKKCYAEEYYAPQRAIRNLV